MVLYRATHIRILRDYGLLKFYDNYEARFINTAINAYRSFWGVQNALSSNNPPPTTSDPTRREVLGFLTDDLDAAIEYECIVEDADQDLIIDQYPAVNLEIRDALARKILYENWDEIKKQGKITPAP